MALVVSPVSRREALGLLGAAALAVVAAACGGSSSGSAASSRSRTSSSPTSGSSGSTSSSGSASSTASCVLTPEMTEGPYYIDGEAVRRDITEGKPGMPLRLDLTVVDADTCSPIPGASVEVWHADATGNYSGFGSATSNRTFLRGVQRAGDDGTVTFQTLYPGWYPGRAVHIHLKVHNGGNQVHTTQLFFDEDVSDAVFATSPYNSRSGQRTTSSQDGIYRDGGAQSTLRLARDGDGYVGTLTLGIRDQV
jgi:protocatechuate 3,4-dioxygenase beta subunit